MAKSQANKAKTQQNEFQEEVLQLDRVTRVQKGGRRMRFRATVIVGNRKGTVGIGMGKSTEVVTAIQQAVTRAKKNMVRVPITKAGTVPNEFRAKFKASRIIVLPASEGTGIIAGGATRVVLDLAGYSNVLSKRVGSDNKITNAYATILGLSSLDNNS